jgi:hypothetical protein
MVGESGPSPKVQTKDAGFSLSCRKKLRKSLLPERIDNCYTPQYDAYI